MEKVLSLGQSVRKIFDSRRYVEVLSFGIGNLGGAAEIGRQGGSNGGSGEEELKRGDDWDLHVAQVQDFFSYGS